MVDPVTMTDKVSTSTSATQGCVAIGCLASVLIPIIAFVGFVGFSLLFPEQKTDAQKLKEWQTGGAPLLCERKLQELLRDPDSYKRNGDFTETKENNSEVTIGWEFRAKNGFGGYTPGLAKCKVSKSQVGIVEAEIVDQ